MTEIFIHEESDSSQQREWQYDWTQIYCFLTRRGYLGDVLAEDAFVRLLGDDVTSAVSLLRHDSQLLL